MRIKKYGITTLVITLLLIMLVGFVGCNKKEYTVQFSDDGQIIEQITEEVGATITFSSPEKEGFVFYGWYKNTTFTDGPYTNYVSDDETSIIFYARWVKEEDVDVINVIEAINQLPDVITKTNESEIVRIKGLYDALSIEKQADVTNDDLLANKWSELQEIITQSNQYIERINQLPSNVTLDDLSEVSALNNEIIDLPSNRQTFISNYDLLEEKVATITNLQSDVSDVVALINALDDVVTINSVQAINNASAAYNNLDEISQKYVTNYSELTEKQNTLNQHLTASSVVVEAIKALPTSFTLDDEETVAAARQKYDALAEITKGFVDNYNVLVEAEAQIELLKVSGDAQEVNKGIAILPSIITYNEKDKVDNLLAQYQKLNTEQKALVTLYSRLESAKSTIEAIENDTSTITYVLGDFIYTSKDELFTAFFSDFYNFIDYQYGRSVLHRNNIYTMEDFLDLASDMNGGGTDNLRGIGNIAGPYLLTKDLNGVVEDQTDTRFIGFCYQNGLYEDLIPFFIRFFAYWRIDERYANLNNYGADFFAESWAPTVDIGKFFYYNENTSYVKSARMIDCLTNTAHVVYGDLPTKFSSSTLTLPTQLTLRGYQFAGWYDNSEFTGSPVTTITDNNKKVILYAKWVEDQNQQDIDSAALVDVYIYNLMPKPAALNKTNVQKVRKLYNNLSSNAKNLVTRYATLLEYENSFASELSAEKQIVVNVMKPTVMTDFNTMKQAFLTDFNSVTGTSITDFATFTSSRYTLMANIRTFFTDTNMYTKWAFILNYFATNENVSAGLRIQSNRLLNHQTGDTEYVAKAIDGFFSQTNLSSDSEVGINFITANSVCSDTTKQCQMTLTFTKEEVLPSLTLSGYTFVGYFTENNQEGAVYTTVSDDTPTTLYALFK